MKINDLEKEEYLTEQRVIRLLWFAIGFMICFVVLEILNLSDT